MGAEGLAGEAARGQLGLQVAGEEHEPGVCGQPRQLSLTAARL